MSKQSNFQRLHPALQLFFYIIILSLAFLVKHPLELLVLYIAAVCSLEYRNQILGEKAFKDNINFYFLPFLLALISALLNSLFRHYGQTFLYRFSNGNYLTLDAIIDGAAGGFRMGLVILWLSHMSKNMSTNSILFLFKPLFPKFALLLTLTLRFFPYYLREAKELVTVEKLAAQNKKLDFKSSWQTRANVISHLSSWALESSVNTAEYMQARGFGLSKQKSCYRLYRWQTKDSILLTITILSFACYLILHNNNYLDFVSYPVIYVAPWQNLNYLMLFALTLIALLPFFTDLGKY